VPLHATNGAPVDWAKILRPTGSKFKDWLVADVHLPSALKSKAEKAHPDEYRRATKKYAYSDEY
jgi:hypothetical protein